jgi:hypothetical protein
MSRQREEIEGEQEVGLPLLGYTVVASVKGVEVDRPTILSLLGALDFQGRLGAALPADYLPGLPEANTGLMRAVRRWMRDLATTEEGKQALGIDEDEKAMLREITKGTKGSDIVALALVVESSDLSRWGLSYLTNLRVFYIKSTDTLSLTRDRTAADVTSLARSAEDQALLASLEPYWQRYRSVYCSADLARMQQRILSAMNPSDLRKQGGVYFVPYEYRDVLQQLKDLLEVQLPAAPGQQNTSSLVAIPVIDRPTTRRQLGTIAYKSLMADIVVLQKDLERFVEEAKTPKRGKDGQPKVAKDGQIKYGKPRASTIAARLVTYRQMRDRITLYTEKLGMQQENLLAALNGLQQTAQALIEASTDEMADDEDAGEAALPPAQVEDTMAATSAHE